MVLATLFGLYSVLMSSMPLLYWMKVNDDKEYDSLDWGAFVILGVGLLVNLVPVILKVFRLTKEFFTGSIMMILLLPFYVNVILIYSYCNIHDVSWGSRPS